MKIRSSSFVCPDGFTTYPHMNAYVDGGQAMAYMRLEKRVRHLCLRDLISGEDTQLTEFEPDSGGGCWEVALEAPFLAMVTNNCANIMDLRNSAGFTTIYQAPEGKRLDGLCSLSRDGSRLLCREYDEHSNTALEIDVQSGAVRRLFSFEWFANHFHYCPFDESWVAFAHEGWTEDITDRCWVWHAEHAPDGRVAFDQASDIPGVRLCVGHERWGFHDASAYVPAYLHSPAGKRGLYEIFGDGRPPRLRWESDVIWHCTMDVSGRYAAVDTSGPFRDEPYSEAEYRKHLAYFKKRDAARESMEGDVVVLDLEAGESLFLAEAQWTRHPYHPHPAISPDGRWVAWNDSHPDRRGMWMAELDLVSLASKNGSQPWAL